MGSASAGCLCPWTHPALGAPSLPLLLPPRPGSLQALLTLLSPCSPATQVSAPCPSSCPALSACSHLTAPLGVPTLLRQLILVPFWQRPACACTVSRCLHSGSRQRLPGCSGSAGVSLSHTALCSCPCSPAPISCASPVLTQVLDHSPVRLGQACVQATALLELCSSALAPGYHGHICCIKGCAGPFPSCCQPQGHRCD